MKKVTAGACQEVQREGANERGKGERDGKRGTKEREMLKNQSL